MESTTALVVRGDRVVLPGGVQPAAIHIRDGRIAAIDVTGDRSAGPRDRAGREIDAAGLVVSPGLVDTHVHVNDPGREHWEGFTHATRAAAAGGVTTLVDMPLNSIPATTTVAALEAKRRASAGRCQVDVGFWGGVVPGNTADLEPLARAGVLGFKCFLCPSGVDEFPPVTETGLRGALPVLARLNLPLLVHAELPAGLVPPDGSPARYSTWLQSRPPAAEQYAIDLLIGLAREFQVRVHVVHLASADALMSLTSARADGVSISIETCPHYLSFAAEDIADGSTVFKCAPPIRGRTHRDGLWRGLIDGAIDLIVTDHSPAPPDLKHLDDGDFVRAWGGIASLQLGLAAVWTGARSRGQSVERLAEWMSAGPARLAGLASSKGHIGVGQDADLIFWDPDAEFRVEANTLHHRHPATPFAGMRLFGRVRTTMLRGQVIFDESGIVGDPIGRVVRTGVG